MSSQENFFPTPYSDHTDLADDYSVDLGNASSVNNALRQREVTEKKKEEEVKKNEEEEKKRKDERTKKFRREASKRRFRQFFRAVFVRVKSFFFQILTFFIGKYWFERDSETGKTQLEHKTTRIVMAHGKKISLFFSILIFLLFIWIIWNIGWFFGLWGVIPLSDVYYEGSMKIPNTWIPEWIEPSLFDRIRFQPLINVDEEDLINRLIEQEIDGVIYNVSFGRLAESMREKSKESSCISAIHLGVRLPIYQVGKYWMVNPKPTATSREKWTAEGYDRYVGKMNVRSPLTAKAVFLTQTGSKGRVELSPVECGCLATLTSITNGNGESLFS